MKPTTPAFLGALIAGLGLAACSILEPRPDLTQFYVLRLAPPPQGGQTATPLSLALRVGPGTLTGYLESTRIAVDGDQNRLELLEEQRWSETLSRGLARALGERLSADLGLAQVTLYPDPLLAPLGCGVEYTVNRLDGPLDGPMTLDVFWRLVELPSARVLYAAHAVHEVPPGPAPHDVPAYVERVSAAVGLWADEIAAAVRAHDTGRG